MRPEPPVAADAGTARARCRRPARVAALAAIVAAAVLLVAACAGTPPGPRRPAPEFAFADPPYAVDGRLSARHAGDAVAVHFAWRHDPPRDELIVTTPLGQTVAELSGDTAAGRVEVRTADGRRAEASDWPTLTERALGFPLPVSGLSAWIRAEPRRGAPYSVEADAEGRVAVLRQDGWEIVYDYADDATRTPQRVRIAYPEFEIRVVIDRWR